jgi:hypothetical protein
MTQHAAQPGAQKYGNDGIQLLTPG